jgi:Bacterial archaeo-eukaryotic release factor family 2
MKTTRLSTLYQASGPFATVMLDVSHDNENGEHEHELRVRAAAEDLAQQGAPDSVVSEVTARLGELVDDAAPVGRIVVANESGVLFDDRVHARVDQPLVCWSPLPDLARWVEHQDAVTPFVLAIVDHEGGDVSAYSSDVPEPDEQESVKGETNRVHKVPVGGWSALRYQHVTENVWARNAEAVADEVVGHIRDGYRLVLLAGDPQSRPTVLARLEETPATVVELDTGTRAADGGDEALQQAVREALMDQVVTRRVESAHALRDRLGADNAVATGVHDIADAFVRGQVETVLMDVQGAAELTLDPSEHPGLAVGPAQLEATEPLRADQALIAAAVATAADVEVAPRAALGGAPVAALLRWHQQAVGTDAP